MKFFIHKPSGLLLALAILAGCSVTPKPLEEQAMSAANQQDMEFIKLGAPEISGALTLEESIARALKYNLEHRVSLFEQALAAGQLEVGKYDLLPQFLADAGYAWRDEENSRFNADGSNSASTDKKHTTTSFGFYWSLLDFGLSYFNAKESADASLIAVERRRRAMHNLIQEVETNFWLAAAAQKLHPRVIKALREGESALERSRAISKEKISDPETALQYQRNLLENLRLLESVNRQLMSARSEFASLIGESPSSSFKLAMPKSQNLLQLSRSVKELEELALINNPDLRIKHYESRIAVIDTQRTLLKLMPNLSFNFGQKTDDDTFLVNDKWRDAGLQVSYNLINLLSAPDLKKISELNVELAVTKRAAVQMSLLTQLHLSLQEYRYASNQYHRARDIHNVDSKLAKLTLSKQQSALASDLDRISTEVTSILSEVRHFHSLAKMHEAESRIQATVGLEPKIGSLDGLPLAALTDSLRISLKNNSLFTQNAEESYQPVLWAEADTKLYQTPKPFNALSHRNTWVQLGAYRDLENASNVKNQAMAVLRDNKNVLAVLSAPSIEQQQEWYLVRFGPYMNKNARQYASGLRQLLKTPVAVIAEDE